MEETDFWNNFYYKDLFLST